MNKGFPMLAVTLLMMSIVAIGCSQLVVEEPVEKQVTEDQITGKLIVDGGTSFVVITNRFGQIFKEETGTEVIVSGMSTGRGIRSAGEGRSNIGMGGRDLRNTELAEFPNLKSFRIAKEGISIIVHPNNPVNNLTINEVQKIFSGEIENWNQVGGENAKIIIATRQVGGGLRDVMLDVVMEDASICETAVVKYSTSKKRYFISENEFSIGYVGTATADETVKSIKVNGIAPTYENVRLDIYPITRFMYFYTLEEPDALEQKFIDLALSNEGQTLLKKYGFVSLLDL